MQSSRFGGPDGRTDQVRGRLDAVLIASLIGPVTRHIGLVPTAVPTHTEPFHLASAIATLDYVSSGRAGWRPQISGRPSEAAHVGFRTFPRVRTERSRRSRRCNGCVQELFDEAADAVEVVRRLWDSWEDDAIIKDKPTGRYIDRDKLHYVDFDGPVLQRQGSLDRAPPTAGQPGVAALAHSTIPFEFAARSADVVFVTPADTAAVRRWVDDVRLAEQTVERRGRPAARCSPTSSCSSTTTAWRPSGARQHLDALDGAPVPLGRRDLRRHAERARRSAARVARPTGSTGSGCGRA